MKMQVLLILLIFTTLFTSCVPYQPVVDTAYMQDDREYDQYERDLAECQMLARRHSDPAGAAIGGAAVGGGIGAALGAVIAAIFHGNVGRGAAFGAVVGGTQGAAGSAMSADRKYAMIYGNCMRGRGYDVIY